MFGLRQCFRQGAKSLGCIFQREPSIANDTQGIVGILVVKLQSLLVGASEHHLRTSTHSHRSGMAVQGFLGEILALLQDIIIKVRQDGTVEADGILHQENHLHARLLDVMLQVHLVLYQLDDGKNQVGITQPTEHVVEDTQVFVLHTLSNAMRERSQHHAVDVRELALDVACHVESIIVGIARHTNHKVDDGGAQDFGSLLSGRYLGEGWRVSKSQFHILIIYLLLDTSIVFQHKRIVWVCHNQHIIDTTHHQIDKRHIFQIELIPLLWYIIFHISCFKL